MKKLFRIASGDESRILFILADDKDEDIDIANEKVNADEYPQDCEFIFSSDGDSVFEVNMDAKSQVIEDLSIDSFA